jgi:PhnB protein
MGVKPIPEGYHSVTPYLILKNASQAINFYQQAFNAKELMRIAAEGKVGHAEIMIGNSPIMLADETPDMGYPSPQTLGGTSVSMVIYVEDVDHIFQQALTAGAKELRPVKDQFYGDRMGTLIDPFGHIWSIATHKEDLTSEEIMQRAQTAMQG